MKKVDKITEKMIIDEFLDDECNKEYRDPPDCIFWKEGQSDWIEVTSVHNPNWHFCDNKRSVTKYSPPAATESQYITFIINKIINSIQYKDVKCSYHDSVEEYDGKSIVEEHGKGILILYIEDPYFNIVFPPEGNYLELILIQDNCWNSFSLKTFRHIFLYRRPIKMYQKSPGVISAKKIPEVRHFFCLL